jgi:solute:Na+ symporter, SSS family
VADRTILNAFLKQTHPSMNVQDQGVALYFWIFLVSYGAVMYLLAPRARSVSGFFFGASAGGAPPGAFALTCSIFISWIFAKSVTNAANLGAEYGFVGGLAYATYWLSIPIAGLIIFRLRRSGAQSLIHFLVERYGRAAAAAFALAILIRLYNDIWSNTAVVAGYFGPAGSMPYLAAGGAFTLAILTYSIKGGLRGSLMTDVYQTLLFGLLLAMMLFFILPESPGIPTLIRSGNFSLAGGVDLLLVAALQAFSYPLHDPVLTDRGFITAERAMLRAFLVSGILGFLGILAFSLIGVHAHVAGIATASNAPAAVAQTLGLALLLPMALLMMISAGSTLDSTFSALARYFSVELARLRQRGWSPTVKAGTAVMVVFAVLGNLPLFGGADILQATTISGTMVMGLAPVFLLYRFLPGTALSFHLAFWPGLAIGLLLAADLWPRSLAIGDGDSSLLLGANFYGLIACTLGYLLPAVRQRLKSKL